MRLQLFEFEDLPWFPGVIRKGGTDYLRYFLNTTEFYEPVVPILHELITFSKERNVLDLCSGGGGCMESIAKKLIATEQPVRITLTDKYPNTKAFEYISLRSGGVIGFKTQPVDVKNVPADLTGARTIFSAAHHFKPEEITAILNDAVEAREPIAIFDGGDKNLLMIIGLLIVHPITFFLCTPFFRPFSIQRIIFTYLLPLIPIMTVWDGAISILRLHGPAELLQAAKRTNASHYKWKAGKLKNKWGFRISYLTGYPVQTN